ncbi:transposase family protein, partial [bacterium]|nr:transposase family protein [bacterium]
ENSSRIRPPEHLFTLDHLLRRFLDGPNRNDGGGESRIYLRDNTPDLLWPCPECGAMCALHDHQPERQWRHLDTCQYKTILHAAPPRSNCPEHGARVVKLPWAEPGGRFTALFEALAISWLKAASQKEVAGLLRMTWEEIHHVMACAVRRGMERRKDEPVANLGVDEKSFKKRHKYLTVVNDLDGTRVLYVAPGRAKTSLDGFWPTLTKQQSSARRSARVDRHVGSVHRLDQEARGERGGEDRLRQVPCSGAPWKGSG